MIRTVFFDLDGTLLPVDTDALIAAYLADLTRYMAPHVPPRDLVRHLLAATEAVIGNPDPGVTNADAFWAAFTPRVGLPRQVLEPVLDRFYAEEFPRLRRLVEGRQVAAPAVVQAVLDLGCEIVLATNPVFPRVAIAQRMAWAGVDRFPWRLVTALEDMHACKPQRAYYQEILDRLGRRPEECAMVGNDVEEDGAAAALGIAVYIATDHLVHRGEGPIPYPHGPLTDVPVWLAAGARGR